MAAPTVLKSGEPSRQLRHDETSCGSEHRNRAKRNAGASRKTNGNCADRRAPKSVNRSLDHVIEVRIPASQPAQQSRPPRLDMHVVCAGGHAADTLGGFHFFGGRVDVLPLRGLRPTRRDARQMIIKAARELKMEVVPEGGSLFQMNTTMILEGPHDRRALAASPKVVQGHRHAVCEERDRLYADADRRLQHGRDPLRDNQRRPSARPRQGDRIHREGDARGPDRARQEPAREHSQQRGSG